jgi:hypothetical protein
VKPRTAAFCLLACLLAGARLDALDAQDQERERAWRACQVAYRAAVDRLEGPDVALEAAATDAYEIPECAGVP